MMILSIASTRWEDCEAGTGWRGCLSSQVHSNIWKDSSTISGNLESPSGGGPLRVEGRRVKMLCFIFSSVVSPGYPKQDAVFHVLLLVRNEVERTDLGPDNIPGGIAVASGYQAHGMTFISGNDHIGKAEGIGSRLVVPDSFNVLTSITGMGKKLDVW